MPDPFTFTKDHYDLIAKSLGEMHERIIQKFDETDAHMNELKLTISILHERMKWMIAVGGFTALVLVYQVFKLKVFVWP